MGDTRSGFPAGLSFDNTLVHAILDPALVQRLDPAAIANRHIREGLSLKVALLALYQLGQGVPPGAPLSWATTAIPVHGMSHGEHVHVQADVEIAPGPRLIAPAPFRTSAQGELHYDHGNAQADICLAPNVQWSAPFVAPVAASGQGKSHDEYGYS